MKQQPRWQWMYATSLWRRRRSAQLQQHPLCNHCLQKGLVTAATVVHHTTPHRGSWDLFLTTPLESLCKSCHDSHTASVERAGLPVKPRIGLDGWPE